MCKLKKLDLWEKKRGNIDTANSRVGNAHVANVFPTGEGLVCVQGEREAKYIPEDVDFVF
jgi:hypothetical protein